MSDQTPGQTLFPPEETEAPPPADAAHDPRFPWKAKGTRKRLSSWDRSKFLLLFGVVFGLLVWNDYIKFEPVMTWAGAVQDVAASQRWLLVLIILEALRQVHFLISEMSAHYNQFWTQRVFGRFTSWSERKFNPWTRYRMMRVFKVLFWVGVLALVLGKVTGSAPVVALFKAPALFVQALPFILQVVFFMALAVLQFVAIFWFMSKGGVDTYFPDDIETRFSDVWGQDHVLARVKENVVLLENPESIEAKGGHVPSGILLWGPPGTGKTLMAEAVAGETGKPYVFVDPGAFNAMFFGVGILKVKSLFRKLRKLALRYGGVIVFFDEADSLGSRGSVMGGQPGYDTPAPWEAAGCNGFTHLSPQARWLVSRSAMGPSELDAAPPRRGINRVVGFPVNGGMGGGGGMGTLQALLTELSGLKKPRGFFNRVVRRSLGMRPKPPPKYRILVMMASNLPEALDPALLRPGRIDRIYRVGYPSKAGRIRTYEGYFAKVSNDLTAEQIDKLATITPYATGASIKDTVNEALIYAIREGRETITWKDVVKAKQLKELGPPEDVEYIERERHAVAVHEACHAVLAWATRRHMEIDIATIEKGSTYLGMVASIPPEDQFTQWRSEYESDILVSVASLAGERLFYGGDNSSGVSGDLENATAVATMMEGFWGMGTTVSSHASSRRFEVGTPGGRGKGGEEKDPTKAARTALADRIEDRLGEMLIEAERILVENRGRVLALAHALEAHKTLTGDDVVAVLEGRPGPLVDGRPYADPAFIAELETYHAAAVEAHRHHAAVAAPLPVAPVIRGELLVGEVLGEGNGHAAPTSQASPWARPAPPAEPGPNGSGTASGEAKAEANGEANGAPAQAPAHHVQDGPGRGEESPDQADD